MQGATDISRIRGILTLARSHINQQEPDLAIETLRRIREEVESFPNTLECAEFQLLLGEAYNAKHSQHAGSFLHEAGKRIGDLPEIPLDLDHRLHYGVGYFCQQIKKKPSEARKHYEQAKEAAVRLGNSELVARSQLRIIHIDLEIDSDPELANFKSLRRVSHSRNLLCEDQLAAWHLHLGELDCSPTRLVYARGFAKRNDEYFYELLSTVRLRQ
jgi:hypothetical protein